MSNIDEFLAHYGVPGMRWGVTRSQYKSMSKDDRKAQKVKEIEAARLRGAKGTNFKNYAKAKGNIKVAKANLKAAKKDLSSPEMVAKKKAGLDAAKATLKKVKMQNQEDYINGTSAKNGKELATKILLGDLGTSIILYKDQKRLLNA